MEERASKCVDASPSVSPFMAWGKPDVDPSPSWLHAIASNDSSVRSLCVLPSRAFDEGVQIALARALRANAVVERLSASGRALTLASAREFANAIASNATLKAVNLGDESFGDASEGTSALNVVLDGVAANAGLETIALDGKGVSDSSACALARALRGCATLREISIGRNPALSGRGLKTALDGASGAFEALDASESELDDDGAEALKGLLSSSKVSMRELSVARCVFTNEGLSALGSGLAACATLRRLNASGVRLGDGGAATFFARTKDDGVEGELAEIDLAECGICEARDVEALDAFLRAARRSSAVNLRGNAFGDAGMYVLAAGAFSARAPQSLDLSSCGLTARAVDALKVPLSTSTSLSVFDNPKLGDDGISRLFAAADASSVSCLDLGAVGLTTNGLSAIVEALKSAQTFTNLRTLIIGGNPGAQEDSWERLVTNLRGVRPSLDVAWRAADGGDDSKLQRDAQGRVIGVDNSHGLP